ncbi:MAG: 50S ribosomal protein L2 [Candidatus Woesearchaeota archaeon]|nr:50S ribosomal protein L2 [Candidatus Woesearchaeota archaeon]
MGKNLIQQARGKGGPTYRAPSFRYKAKVSYPDQAKSGTVIDFIKCPGHSSPLALIKYDSGEETYVIAAHGQRTGDVIQFCVTNPNSGDTVMLKDVPVGTALFNIEGRPGDGGKFVRSSGCFARIVGKTEKEVLIMLPSKKQKSFNLNCRATIGVIAGSGRKEKPFLKAGTRFHYMKARNKLYPRIKGQSQNAVDHPFGTSRSSKKGKPTIARKNAPPGAKVGKIRPRRTGMKR